MGKGDLTSNLYYVRRIVIAAEIIAVVLLLLYVLVPRSFHKYIDDCESVTLILQKDHIDDNGNVSIQHIKTVEISSEDEEYNTVMQTLEKYTYHATIRTLLVSINLDDPGIEGNISGYWLQIHLYDKNGNCIFIVTGENKEIQIEDQVFEMSNGRSRDFQAEMSGIIE